MADVIGRRRGKGAGWKTLSTCSRQAVASPEGLHLGTCLLAALPLLGLLVRLRPAHASAGEPYLVRPPVTLRGCAQLWRGHLI